MDLSWISVVIFFINFTFTANKSDSGRNQARTDSFVWSTFVKADCKNRELCLWKSDLGKWNKKYNWAAEETHKMAAS